MSDDSAAPLPARQAAGGCAAPPSASSASVSASEPPPERPCSPTLERLRLYVCAPGARGGGAVETTHRLPSSATTASVSNEGDALARSTLRGEGAAGSGASR
jgi:hypothetical protein